MNVIVLAGSPKGSQSITAEYVRYLAARRSVHRSTSTTTPLTTISTACATISV